MITNMTNLVLYDKAEVPVGHVFTPIRTGDQVSTWIDREHNNGIAIGYTRVGYQVREPVKARGVFRHTITMAMPLVSFAIADAPVLLGTARAKTELLLPDTMTDQQRKDFLEMYQTIFLQGQAANLGDNIVVQSQPY